MDTDLVVLREGERAAAVGDTVPMVYDPGDPAGTAQADILFAAWGDIMGLAWIGLGFTLFPFFGVRAAFRCR